MKKLPYGLLIFLGLCLMYFVEYAQRGAWQPDEARYIYVAQEMRSVSSWAIPMRSGEYYAHKPPLLFWMQNGFASVLSGGHISPFVARLPILLGLWLSLTSVYRLMRHWGREQQAWLAVFLCASTFLFWDKGRMGQIDGLLCGLEMTALSLLFTGDQKRQNLRAVGAFTCMGLAILAKGPVGFIVPVGAYLCARLTAKEGRTLKKGYWIWAWIFALALPAAWIYWITQSHPPPGYLEELLHGQNIERAKGNLGHVQPIWYFLKYLPVDFLPWTFFIPLAWKVLNETPEDRIFRNRLFGWILFVVLFFTVITSKRNLYILLCYPAGAMMIAASWPGIARMAATYQRRVALFFLSVPPLAAVGALAFPALPIARWALVPPLVGCLILLWNFIRRHPAKAENPKLLRNFALSWLGVLTLASSFVMPALDVVKTPVRLTELKNELPPGQPLHLYKINGEIYPLYMERRGKVIRDDTQLEEAMREFPKGMLMIEEKSWSTMPPAIKEKLDRETMQMGGKDMFIGRWGF